MSISSPVLATKEQLIRIMQDPMYAASVGIPAYKAMVQLQEMNQPPQQAPQPTPTVAQQVIANATHPQGIGGINPMMAMQQQDMMQRAQPMEEPSPQMMAQGGLTELDTGDMFNEQNYAGGGIVAFAKGGSTKDEYGIDMPTVPSWDDLKMENFNAMQQYGVDPKFYENQALELQRQRDELKEDKEKAGWMALANLGFGAAAARPEYGKAQNTLSTWGGSALNAAKELGADLKDIKKEDRLLKQSDMKLKEAQNAQARGDAQTALKAMDERKNTLLNAQLKRAEILSKEAIAKAKATGDSAKLETTIKIAAAKIGEQKFLNAYPSGSVSGYLGDNQALTQFIRNRFVEDTENFLRDGTKPPIPKEKDLIKEFESLYPPTQTSGGKANVKPAAKPVAKPAANLSGPDSLLNIPRPSNIQKIMDKHAANPNKRYITTNTDEELKLLDPIYDNIGPDLDDPYAQ